MRLAVIFAAILLKIVYGLYLMRPHERRIILIALIVAFLIACFFTFYTSQRYPTYQGGPFCWDPQQKAVGSDNPMSATDIPMCEFKLRNA